MIANFLHRPGFWLESNILFGLRSLIEAPKIPALDAQPKDAQRTPLQSCIPIVCRRASNDHVSESPTEIPNQKKNCGIRIYRCFACGSKKYLLESTNNHYTILYPNLKRSMHL